MKSTVKSTVKSAANLSESGDATFDEEARQVLTRLRNALAAILDALPGHVARAHQVSKALGIHKKLGWQIANVVYKPDLFAAGQHVPGRDSVNTFLAAAARRNVSASSIESAEAAMSEFEGLIVAHAGDRESFDMMLAGHAGASAKAHMAQRKTWFASGSFIWGVQTRTQVQTFLLHPAARPGWFDMGSIFGFIGFRRVRPDTSWPFSISKRVTDDDTDVQQPPREPLQLDDGEGDRLAGTPLVRRFCSNPLPDIRRTGLSDGWMLDEIMPGPAGERGAIDCVAAEVLREAGECYRSAHEWTWWGSRSVRTPSRVLILDQLIHEDVFSGPVHPKLNVYRDLDQGGPRPPPPQRQRDRIPVFEAVEHLGRGLASVRTPYVPCYVELIGDVLAALGWDATRFHVFRVQMEYPPVPTTVAMEHPLPERPAQRPNE